MATKPSIQPGEWISIGKQGLVKGVVCTVFRDTIQGDCEVVYLDMGNRAINEDVRWAGSYWEFVHGRGGWRIRRPIRPATALRPHSARKHYAEGSAKADQNWPTSQIQALRPCFLPPYRTVVRRLSAVCSRSTERSRRGNETQ